MTFPQNFPSGTLFGDRVAGGLTWLGAAGDPNNSSEYTFLVPLDDTSTERRVIVAVTTRQTSERSITGVTIGGTSATIHLNLNAASTSNDTDLVICSRLVPAGEGSTIVVTCSGVMDICAVSVWRLDGETSASPHATASDTSLSTLTLSTTIDIPENGAIIAAQCGGPTTGAVTWSGIDEVAHQVHPSLTFSFADRSGLPAEAGHIIQGTFTGAAASNACLLGAISWQYA